MAQKNRSDLTTQANIIKNETVVKANTAIRVGNMNVDEIDSFFNKSDEPGLTPNTWHLNTNGSDANVGSPEFPFETIQAAHDAAAENDTIIIQDIFFSQPSSPGTSITKDLTFKGVTTNQETWTRLKGAWTIADAVVVRFENVSLYFMTLDGPGSLSTYLANCTTRDLKTGSSRSVSLISQSSTIGLATPSNYSQIIANDTDITGAVSVGNKVELYGGSLITGNVTSGLDSTQTLIVSNSTIDGDVVNTGNLIKKNAVVTGTETVSVLPIISRQAKVFDDSVEFKDKVAVGVSTFLNSLDVSGGMAVGSGFAGLSTAPTDGVIIEGPVAIGQTSVGGGIMLDVAGALETPSFISANGRVMSSGDGIYHISSSNNFIRSRVNNLIDMLSAVVDGSSAIAYDLNTLNTLADSSAKLFRLQNNGVDKFIVDKDGAVTSSEKSADPADPAEGSFVKWMSDGTGSGDDGDIMMKITAGAVTKITTLVDFSAI